MAAMPASMKPPNEFLFDTLEGRPFRAISIETELDGPGGELARDLYGCGVIGTDYVMSYGTHPGGSHPHIAFLKHDGSVTAGEVVFDRIYLDNKLHAKAMRVAMEKMRQLEKKGTIAYNPNCGGHIHMDASGYGFYDLLRLMVLFGYLEEPIFRLAGAGKTYGHRSLFKGYDRAHEGRGYSNPVVKGPFTDPVVAMNHFRAQHRMSGLNITKYVAARCKGCVPPLPIKEGDAMPDPKVQNAVDKWLRQYRASGREPTEAEINVQRIRYGEYFQSDTPTDLKNCTCKHQQYTIEWRVWNSQGNPRIMYGWIALMQALHAYAWRPVDDPTYRQHEHREPLGWERRQFDGSDLTYLAKAQERVEFIFTELPLADAEKDALAYTFMRSPYKIWGKDFFRRLAQSPYKAPAFPNEYKGIPVRKIGDISELEIPEVSPLGDVPLSSLTVPSFRLDRGTGRPVRRTLRHLEGIEQLTAEPEAVSEYSPDSDDFSPEEDPPDPAEVASILADFAIGVRTPMGRSSIAGGCNCNMCSALREWYRQQDNQQLQEN